MNLYTIYDSPRDFPDTYIVRRWEVVDNEKEPVAREVFMVDKDLDKIRAELQKKGLLAFQRDEDDDAKIVETWI